MSMQSLHDELKIEIFKYVETPISLLVTNRRWYYISQDCHARAKWLIRRYGRAHAFFHAIRLGGNFVTTNLVQVLLSQKALLSRYFMQRLLAHFTGYDEGLIKCK